MEIKRDKYLNDLFDRMNNGVKSITFKITSADNKLIWFGIF